MRRREFAVLASGAGSAALLAGCAQITGSDGVDLVIRNEDSNGHAYEVTADDGHESRISSGGLAGGESATVRNFVPYLDYAHSATVAVAVDGAHVQQRTVRIRLGGDRITVDILGPETVEIGPDEIYSPSPPDS